MRCVAITPEKTVVDQEVEFIVLPLYDGEFGIGENRAPVVGRLGAGEMRLTLKGGSVERWWVEGGFVEVVDNATTLLANRVVELSSLTVEGAKEELRKTLSRPSNTPELSKSKEGAVQRARTRLRYAEKIASAK